MAGSAAEREFNFAPTYDRACTHAFFCTLIYIRVLSVAILPVLGPRQFLFYPAQRVPSVGSHRERFSAF